ncbi:senescence-associated protein AAF, chlorolplastic isoform X1 [Selaginella moellendorffii]|uniref:senescence-associated protein AAF, chlorolplastic isoform X1 n=1 Tax=Selaginella moellendorffii TaxID=88036 RepID=UPI000D1CDBE8|nr:senescence-associated protein AAF, chlorolplastic isoform X1 [Selaginella moellendorffii]|eukprot:XP_024520886.1 senescence-associated protein AAF, chlorolplastic isoform X1 [Selaginella moellendorffii]
MRIQAGARENGTISRFRAWDCGSPAAAKPCCCRAAKPNGSSGLEEQDKSGHQCRLAEAAKYARQDAMLVTAAAQNMDEKARSNLLLLAREFSRLDMRARQDMALIGSTVTKLDARARERAHRKADRVNRIATKLKEIAGSELKVAATEHWNDGALDADLRLADLRARRRAMEDSFATVQAVKSIHDAAVKVLLMKENAETTTLNPGTDETSRPVKKTTLDRVAEFEEAYVKMASLLAEVNVLDDSDPDELEYIIATLLDMDEVHGASGATLVTQTASSPDIATRRALVDALANAPSLLALGNAGISALQRLAEDENLEVSRAASKALDELQSEWKHIDASMLSNNVDGGQHYLDDTTLMEDPEED